MSKQESQYYWNLEKGYQGELKFDELLQLSSDCLVLNDLLFEINNTIFQIDSLVITQKTIYLFEVKNYEDDYYIKNDDWYSCLSGKVIQNPLDQLKRGKTLFRQLLQSLRANVSLEANLIFVNPHFHLYNAPRNQPIIFPAQIDRFLSKFDRQPSTLNSSHYKLAEKLISLHMDESPYSRVPGYEYERLRKGVICLGCRSFITVFNKTKINCGKCGRKEGVASSILQSVDEFKTLFPNEKITTNNIFEWCGEIFPIKTIHRVLSKNFKPEGKKKATYYIK